MADRVLRTDALTAMRAGAVAAQRGDPLTANPYTTLRTPPGDLLAATWVAGYLAAGGGTAPLVH